MRPVHEYIVKPLGNRYNNSIDVDGKELVINTEVFNHQYVNREAVVIATPRVESLGVSKGDRVVLHHNIFRRWHDVKGIEKNSRSYLREGEYIISPDQMYLYKSQDEDWQCVKGFCFIQPVESDDNLSLDKEESLMGIVRYSDGTVPIGELVGFAPNSEYEFIVDGVRVYRVYSKFITIQYGHQGNIEAHNPSWASSSR